MIDKVSPERRRDILYALSRGTVPSAGLDVLAVGLKRFEGAFDEELDRVASGKGGFRAVRGEYGAGKTFFVRWLIERAKRRGFAASEIQISENETPLHRQETVYRRAMEHLSTSTATAGALPEIVDEWFYRLESDVLGRGDLDEGDEVAVEAAVGQLMESRLAQVTKVTPHFSAVLRAYHRAQVAEDLETGHGLMAWLAGQPNVGASIKRTAGLKGEIDHFGAMNSFKGLLSVLRDSGYAGMLLVLDEMETLQRARRDTREKSLNALRGLLDDLDRDVYPGLYVVITGTPAFLETSPQGVRAAPALMQRLATDFATQARFDNPRAVQIRLQGLDRAGLVELGRKVRDLYALGSSSADRIQRHCNDAYIDTLVAAVAGKFGGRVGITPRLFLKKLVAEVLDRVDQFDDFDPRVDYQLTVGAAELSAEERAAVDVDDIDLEL